jgi:hypothetical protein
MGSLPSLLLGTVVLRPYVFVFLAVYLLGCSMHLGLKRALLFGVAGYLITWISEYSSIHNGFPYGLYYYIEATRDREIWVLGVPMMDSMRYIFSRLCELSDGASCGFTSDGGAGHAVYF